MATSVTPEINGYELTDDQVGKLRSWCKGNAGAASSATGETLTRPLAPVLVGGDLFIYSMSRMFFESYGVRPLVLIAENVKIVTTTKFAEIMYVRGTDDEPTLLGALKAVSDAIAPCDPMLHVLGTGDWYARTFARNAELLRSWGFTTPYCDYDTFDSITQKGIFQGICDELGIAHPGTYAMPCDESVEAVDPYACPFSFPVIAKPSNSAAWHYVEFDGKAKVMTVDSAEELARVYSALRPSCYDKDLLVQDMIPGFDESLYSITCFAWKGKVEFSVLGHVLLQDHAPSAIGNPVVIVGDTEMPAWKVNLLNDARRFLEKVNYTGFANFDVMHDSRDGSYRFLEVNARLGRNSWYLSLAGIDLPRVMVDHWIAPACLGTEPTATYGTQGEPSHASRAFTFKMVPDAVIKRYAASCADKDYALSDKADESPVLCKADTLEHRFWGWVTNMNQIRKFKRYVGDARK